MSAKAVLWIILGVVGLVFVAATWGVTSVPAFLLCLALIFAFVACLTYAFRRGGGNDVD